VNIRRLKKAFGSLTKTPLHPQWLIARKNSAYLASISEEINGSVLDIGCGHQLIKQYINNNQMYIGLDNYYTASQWYESKPDIYANGESLPLASCCINNILLFDVLEHLPEPERCINEISRVLISGGKLILQSPFIYPVHDAPLDFHRWTQYGLRNLIERNNFIIIKEMVVGRPIETAGLIINISLCKTIINSVEKRNPIFLLVLLLPLLIPVINICSLLLSMISPNDDFMPFSYRLIAVKK
jgi:SAM-dependent methyltransferase